MTSARLAEPSIRCRCGEPLLDAYDGRTATVGERSFPLSRRTDFLACPACGSLERVVARWPELLVDDEHPVAVLRELSQERWDV